MVTGDPKRPERRRMIETDAFADTLVSESDAQATINRRECVRCA
jgi:hypothetical protein